MNDHCEPEFGSSSEAGRPTTLGVVTISFNEERDLPGFLRSVGDWVDEIVIVDDGSEDSTEEISREFGPKIKFVKSPRSSGEYFSHQRNKGIAASKSDWLLHLDVDERVPADLADEILSVISDPTKDGYRYRRVNYFMHRPMKGGGWSDWNQIHLARREKFHFGGMFHETCIINCSAERIGQLSSKIIHLNENVFEKRLKKSNQYLEELVTHIETLNRPVTWHQIVSKTIFEFLKKYIFKRGFLDGTPGLISALHSSTAAFRAYALVWDRQNYISRETVEADFERIWGIKTDVLRNNEVQ